MDIYGLNLQRICIVFTDTDKKCPSCSRIVPDTEYTTNLRLKISMLVQKFCAPPPAIQQWKLSSRAKNIYSAKLKMFFLFSFFKN